MKLLLDTHLLLWAANEPGRLPKAARALMEDEGNELLFSAASLWEVTIKSGLGRADFQVDARLLRRALLDNGYEEMPFTSEHAVNTDRLPAGHKDPFDRMLVAQAIVEGITLLTNDRTLLRFRGRYGRYENKETGSKGEPGVRLEARRLKYGSLQDVVCVS